MKKRSNKKKKENFFLKEQYLKSWNYLKESKNFIFLAIGIFFAFAFLGFFVKLPEEFSNMILDYLKEIILKTENLSSLGLIKFIFLNNLQSSFVGMVFGFVFGIVPILALIANGFVVGFVSAMAVKSAGFGTLLYLLPHGIFELPAIFISLGLGIKFGTFIFRKNQLKKFRNFLWESLRVFIFVVLPLLIVAGIIEGLLI